MKKVKRKVKVTKSKTWSMISFCAPTSLKKRLQAKSKKTGLSVSMVIKRTLDARV